MRILLCVIFSLFLMSGCSKDSVVEIRPPNAFVTNGKQSIEAVTGTYEWRQRNWFSTQAVIADSASPYQIAENLDSTIVTANSEAVIQFGSSPAPALTVYIWNQEGREQEIKVVDNKLKFPSEKGKYIYEIFAKWENGEASYTFEIDVS